jgi:hypothetical protein
MDPAKLQQALYKHGVKAIERIRAARPNDTFYSFAFFTSGEFGYAFMTSASYEGLEEVVASYMQKPNYKNDDPVKRRQSLKWSPADSPLHQLCAEFDKDLDKVMGKVCNQFLEVDEDDEDGQAFISEVESAFLGALKQLDEEGRFGSPNERSAIVLNLLKGDQRTQERLEFAGRVNSPEIAARYAREMAEPYGAI